MTDPTRINGNANLGRDVKTESRARLQINTMVRISNTGKLPTVRQRRREKNEERLLFFYSGRLVKDNYAIYVRREMEKENQVRKTAKSQLKYRSGI